MHVIVSKQTIDSFETIRIYIQYLAYLISDDKEHNSGSVSFQFFDFLCPDNILKTDYNILWADKYLFLDKNSAFNFFERFTELYIIIAYDFPPNIKIRDFEILDSNDLYYTFYNKKKLGKSFPEKYKSLGIQLNDPRSYNSFSCIQVILNQKKKTFCDNMER